MKILVVGSGGFIGSAVVRAAAGRPELDVVAAHRTQSPAHNPQIRRLTLDIRDHSALLASLQGVDAVICCVSYVGDDPVQSIETNVDGVLSLIHAVEISGVPRLLYVGTTAVYGTGPHRGLKVRDAILNPGSDLSKARAVADHAIRAHGGNVIRPHLVYGPGDRWFEPTLLSITRQLDAYIDGGEARLSVIHVDELATDIIQLVAGDFWTPRTAWHPYLAKPLTVSNCIDRLVALGLIDPPRRSISRDEAHSEASRYNIRPRHIDMLSLDHWYEPSFERSTA